MDSGPTFDFRLYNPRIPPKDAVDRMAKVMRVSCFSDIYYLKAAVSRKAVTNISDLLPVYSSTDFATIPHIGFRSTAIVYFLTGGTRNEASRIVFQSLRPSTKKPRGVQEADNDKSLDRSVTLFKVANWVVQLYDYGVCFQPYLQTLPADGLCEHDTDELLRLGSSFEPLRRRNTLLLYLAQNPNLVNTPQTPQESYRQHWMESLDQNKTTMTEFFKRCITPASRRLEAALCSCELIGVTKFAIETCEMLSMSKITDLGLLSGDNVGMEVCGVLITEPSDFNV